MKLTKTPTPYQQLHQRLQAIGCLHHDCSIYNDPIAPMMNVLSGKQCVVMVADSPFMVVRYVDKAATQWLFDMYGN